VESSIGDLIAGAHLRAPIYDDAPNAPIPSKIAPKSANGRTFLQTAMQEGSRVVLFE